MAIKIFEKLPLQPNIDPASKSYRHLLTPYAFNLVQVQMSKRETVVIDPVDDSEPTQYTAAFSEGPVTITLDSCTCNAYISTRLLCRHIFKVREQCQENLFNLDLVAARWTNDRYKETLRVFRSDTTSSAATSEVSATLTSSPRPARLLSQA